MNAEARHARQDHVHACRPYKTIARLARLRHESRVLHDWPGPHAHVDLACLNDDVGLGVEGRTGAKSVLGQPHWYVLRDEGENHWFLFPRSLLRIHAQLQVVLPIAAASMFGVSWLHSPQVHYPKWSNSSQPHPKQIPPQHCAHSASHLRTREPRASLIGVNLKSCLDVGV